MGQVISGRFAPRRAERESAPRGPAEIVFFTGVRYARIEGAPEAPDLKSPQAGGGKRKRKRG